MGSPACPAAGLLAGTLGEILYEWGELGAAEGQFEASVASNAVGANNGVFLPTWGRVGVRLARDDREGVLAVLTELGARSARSEIARARSRDMALAARIHLALGDIESACAWADASRLSPGDSPTYQKEFELLTLARVYVAAGRPAEVLPLLERLRLSAEAAGRSGRVIEARAVEARAMQATGDQDGANAALAEALRLAEPAGYLRTFVDAGSELVPVLRRLAAEGPTATYASRILKRMDAGEASASDGNSLLADPLSARELEVLRLLASGRTNAEIADDLVVSLATVKTHVQNVYAKLDVHGRTHAVARARDLGVLLDS